MTKKVIIICWYKYRSSRRRGRRYEREEFDERLPLDEKKSNKKMRMLIDESGHIDFNKVHDYVREKVKKPYIKECRVHYHYYD